MDTYNFTLEEIKKFEGTSGIYALIYNDQVIYIGQSKNIASRLREHRREGKLQSVIKESMKKKNRTWDLQIKMYGFINAFRDKMQFAILQETTSLNYWEAELIRKYRPKFNYVGVKVPYKKNYHGKSAF